MLVGVQNALAEESARRWVKGKGVPMSKRNRRKKRRASNRHLTALAQAHRNLVSEPEHIYRVPVEHDESEASCDKESPLSDRILAIGGSLIANVDGYTNTYNMTITAVAAWNASLNDDESASEEAAYSIARATNSNLAKDAVFIIYGFVTWMIQEKRRMFPNDQRMVVDYDLDVSEDGETIHLQVTSLNLPDVPGMPIPILPGFRVGFFAVIRYLFKRFLARLGIKLA